MASHPALERLEHRPWPIPSAPWAWRQTWLELLFAHWPVAPDAVRASLPPGLELDTFGGQAWVGIVPFRMQGIAPRGLPALPGLSAFPELNLRTYVRFGDRPGVWFWSLDADHWLAVQVARWRFHLPYFTSAMSCRMEGDRVRYRSRRRGFGHARFEAEYGPVGPLFASEPGSLEHWLTERYCLYACDRKGRLARGDIHHVPWPLQQASVELGCSEWPGPFGDWVCGPPASCLFARRLEVVVWGVDVLDETQELRRERAAWAAARHPMLGRGSAGQAL